MTIAEHAPLPAVQPAQIGMLWPGAARSTGGEPRDQRLHRRDIGVPGCRRALSRASFASGLRGAPPSGAQSSDPRMVAHRSDVSEASENVRAAGIIKQRAHSRPWNYGGAYLEGS